MEMFYSLPHSRYDCKYHVVFVPNFWKKLLFVKIRQYLKGVLNYYFSNHFTPLQ